MSQIELDQIHCNFRPPSLNTKSFPGRLGGRSYRLSLPNEKLNGNWLGFISEAGDSL